MHGRDGKTLLLGENAPPQPVQKLTGDACIRASARVRQGLAHFEVTLPAGSELETMLRKLERLGARHPGSLLTAPMSEAEKRDVRYIEQVSRFGTVLDLLRSPHVSGEFTGQVRRFRERLDALTSVIAPAQELLLELEIGAALASGGLDVSFEEPPDLVLSGDGLPALGVACKRPRSALGIDSLVRKGIHQLRARGLPGTILMCVDAIMNVSPNGKPIEFFSKRRAALTEGGWVRFKTACEGLSRAVRRRTDPTLMGIVWLARMPGAVIGDEEVPSFSRNTFLLCSINMDHWEDRPAPLERIAEALYRGIE